MLNTPSQKIFAEIKYVHDDFLSVKVDEMATIRNRYDRIPQLSLELNGKGTHII